MLLVGAEVVAVQVWRTDPDRISQRQAETAVEKVVDATRRTAVQTLGRVQRS